MPGTFFGQAPFSVFEDNHESRLRLPVGSAVKRGLGRLTGRFSGWAVRTAQRQSFVCANDNYHGCHVHHCCIVVPGTWVPRSALLHHGYPLSSGLSESGRNWRMNDGPVGDGSYGDDLLNQSSGDPPDAAGLAPVETKRVLVQVSSEVLTACASVIGPE